MAESAVDWVTQPSVTRRIEATSAIDHATGKDWDRNNPNTLTPAISQRERKRAELGQQGVVEVEETGAGFEGSVGGGGGGGEG